MKQFTRENFNRQDDIQIQVPTCRLGIRLSIDEGATPIDQVQIRARLVSPNFGTRTIIERTGIKTLMEIAAQGEGFFRTQNVMPGDTTLYSGCIDISRGGALMLTNQTYISVDISTVNGTNINSVQLFALQHPKTTETYLHYNPVTINQSLQNVQLDRATHVVLPIDYTAEIQLHYAGTSVSHTNEELRFIGDMSNDIVSVNKDDNNVIGAHFGYSSVIVFPVRDPLSLMEASRVQVERTEAAPSQFTVLLIEEKTL